MGGVPADLSTAGIIGVAAGIAVGAVVATFVSFAGGRPAARYLSSVDGGREAHCSVEDGEEKVADRRSADLKLFVIVQSPFLL